MLCSEMLQAGLRFSSRVKHRALRGSFSWHFLEDPCKANTTACPGITRNATANSAPLNGERHGSFAVHFARTQTTQERMISSEMATLTCAVGSMTATATEVIVTGARTCDASDAPVIWHVLDAHAPTRLIEGGARGADTIAREWAAARGVPCRTVEAEWDLHGYKAGNLRNLKMLRQHPHATVLAFPKGASPGTRHCIRAARALQRRTFVFELGVQP